MKTNEAKVIKNTDKSFIITFTLDQDDIAREKAKVLAKIQKNFETKGFRKGKAPLSVVEQNVSTSQLIEEAASNLISDKYNQIITDQKIQPIIQPQVKILNAPVTAAKDWQVEIQGCELPDIKVDSTYKQKIKKINASSPAKSDNHSRLDAILDTLLSLSQTSLPSILVQADTNQRISQLVDQVSQSGLTIADYFKAQKTTPEKYRQQVAANVTKEWTLNLAIAEIAKSEGLKIEQSDIEAALKKNNALANNPNLLYYLIQQQKVIDFLQKL